LSSWDDGLTLQKIKPESLKQTVTFLKIKNKRVPTYLSSFTALST